MKKRILLLALALALCLPAAAGICEETEPVVLDWGEIQVTVYGLSENPELAESMDPAEGKWITLVLIVESGEKNLDEVDDVIHEKIELEGLKIFRKLYGKVGGTIRFTNEGTVQELNIHPGYIRIFFDAPADYDLQSAKLFYDGKQIPVAVEPEGILTAGE